MQEKPIWLDEQLEIKHILQQFLDKLDAKPAEQWRHPPAITINAQNIPSLFNVDEHADQLWALLRSLSSETSGDYQLLEIRRDKKRNPLDPAYCNARLRLNLERESMLRHWLNRPLQTASRLVWQQAIDENAHCFEGDVERLRGRELKFSGKSPQEVVAAFIRMRTYLDTPVTLRQLSARCFWGDSKFLDNREELVCSLHPQCQLLVRPIVVNVHLPARIDAVLFIENQDNYVHAMCCVAESIKHMAQVYCSGFKGSASRIRSTDGVSLHYSKNSGPETTQSFENWWFDIEPLNWPVYFWGDLDFAGMSILKVLKQRFKNAQAWQPGYARMLQYMLNNDGHAKITDERLTQVDPGLTGCKYADEVLLPAIRKRQRFVDQEIITL